METRFSENSTFSKKTHQKVSKIPHLGVTIGGGGGLVFAVLQMAFATKEDFPATKATGNGSGQ